jgi:hypothetical protein
MRNQGVLPVKPTLALPPSLRISVPVWLPVRLSRKCTKKVSC